jgi:hypothetical protein
MTQIKITATDQELNVTEAPVLASGGVNETEVVFTFDSTWTSYTTKTAVFFKKDSETAYHQLLSNSKATVPQEVLVDDGVLFIGVFGQASSTDVKTSSCSISKCNEPIHCINEQFNNCSCKSKFS